MGFGAGIQDILCLHILLRDMQFCAVSSRSCLAYNRHTATRTGVKGGVSYLILKNFLAEFEFMADPPSISAFDLDVVKLTAQFVARNGRKFLTDLMQREQKNFRFDFLRPTHSLFQYFTKLLEQYTKVRMITLFAFVSSQVKFHLFYI